MDDGAVPGEGSAGQVVVAEVEFGAEPDAARLGGDGGEDAGDERRGVGPVKAGPLGPRASRA